MKSEAWSGSEPGETGASRSTAPRPGESHPERFCPTCGSALLERKCRLLCPDPARGYYMSCSDFY